MIKSDAKAFFRRSGDHYVANDPSRGPWSEDACHAGPVTAVIARELEQAVTDKQLVRLTVVFRRPVPMSGFSISAEPEREGRNVTEANARLIGSDGRVCAVASSLHLSTIPDAEFPNASIPAPDFDEAKPGGFPVEKAVHDLPYFNSGIEVAYPPGESPSFGPTTLWMRTLPIVEGERPSPFQSLCPLADCGNGTSRNGGFELASFVNPDLTVVISRVPVSEWLASSAVSFWESNGLGMSQAQLYDTQGAIGYALQTLVVRPV